MKNRIINSRQKLYYLSVLQTISGRVIRDTINNYIEDYGISMTELTVLNLLMDLNSLGFNEIASTLGVDAPFITELTNGLSKKRLINIQKSDSDKRVKEASLTVDGFRTTKKVNSILNKHLEKLFKDFSKEELELHIKILHSIINKADRSEFHKTPNAMKTTPD